MPRLLIIDDQPHVRAAISVALQANGYEVVAVESGRLGLIELNRSVLDITPFDLVIVDIYMPNMDGLTLIKAMRERSPKLPIVATSGALLPGTGRAVLDALTKAPHLAGITFLGKPFRPKELIQAIHDTIGVPARYRQNHSLRDQSWHLS
jgi:CheY-like chemotaxis protein